MKHINQKRIASITLQSVLAIFSAVTVIHIVRSIPDALLAQSERTQENEKKAVAIAQSACLRSAIILSSDNSSDHNPNEYLYSSAAKPTVVKTNGTISLINPKAETVDVKIRYINPNLTMIRATANCYESTAIVLIELNNGNAALNHAASLNQISRTALAQL